MGIEPTSKAWEAFILPLNYTREAGDFTQITDDIQFTVFLRRTVFLIGTKVSAVQSDCCPPWA